ncbi:hypothetical protein VUR80DRAFT_7540 [Thermomyces stellatus]
MIGYRTFRKRPGPQLRGRIGAVTGHRQSTRLYTMKPWELVWSRLVGSGHADAAEIAPSGFEAFSVKT